MRNQYKILSEKYSSIKEAESNSDKESILSGLNYISDLENSPINYDLLKSTGFNVFPFDQYHPGEGTFSAFTLKHNGKTYVLYKDRKNDSSDHVWEIVYFMFPMGISEKKIKTVGELISFIEAKTA